ncbi:MAG: hypothetical protein QOE31_3515, partial [Solirubrobacteraceae bacterium]|nr:hypothetical protein [Solirubrobacteraceae bacterium]
MPIVDDGRAMALTTRYARNGDV